MFGEKALRRWNSQLSSWRGDTRVGWGGGAFLIQPSHSSLAKGFFSVGLVRECVCDHCWFLRHDQSVSRLINSASIPECAELAEPFIPVLAYTAAPLPSELSGFAALIAALEKSFCTFISRRGVVELLSLTLVCSLPSVAGLTESPESKGFNLQDSLWNFLKLGPTFKPLWV